VDEIIGPYSATHDVGRSGEDAGNRRIGVIDAPVPQGRRHSIRKSVEVPATKSPPWTKSRPVPQSDPQVVVVEQSVPAPMAYAPAPYPNYAYPYPSGYPFTGFATGMVVGGLTAAWAMNWNDNNVINNVNVNRHAGQRRIGVIVAPVPQGRRHSIRKSVEGPATKSPTWTTSRFGHPCEQVAGRGSRRPRKTPGPTNTCGP
jgi:hypothetical protein